MPVNLEEWFLLFITVIILLIIGTVTLYAWAKLFRGFVHLVKAFPEQFWKWTERKR